MTSSNGNIFRVTGPLCEEFTGHRWIPLTKASDAEQRLGQTDRQTNGRTVCHSEEWHTLHTLTPKKWPKHKRKKTYVTFEMVRVHICFSADIKRMFYPHMLIKKTSFSNDRKKRVIFFFAFKYVFKLNVHFFHYKGSSYLRLLFRFKECCTKRPQKGFRIKWYTAALSATLLT